MLDTRAVAGLFPPSPCPGGPGTAGAAPSLAASRLAWAVPPRQCRVLRQCPLWLRGLPAAGKDGPCGVPPSRGPNPLRPEPCGDQPPQTAAPTPGGASWCCSAPAAMACTQGQATELSLDSPHGSPHPAHRRCSSHGTRPQGASGACVLAALQKPCMAPGGSFAGGDTAQQPPRARSVPTVGPAQCLGWTWAGQRSVLALTCTWWRGEAELWCDLADLTAGLGEGQEGAAKGRLGCARQELGGEVRSPPGGGRRSRLPPRASGFGFSWGRPPAGLPPHSSQPPSCPGPNSRRARPPASREDAPGSPLRGRAGVCFPRSPRVAPRDHTRRCHQGARCPQWTAGPDSPRHRPQEARVLAG